MLKEAKKNPANKSCLNSRSSHMLSLKCGAWSLFTSVSTDTDCSCVYAELMAEGRALLVLYPLVWKDINSAVIFPVAIYLLYSSMWHATARVADCHVFHN